MGNDYISREAAYKNMFNIPNPTGAGEIEVVSVDDLEAIPAADVRPVVYCRDCIHLGFKDFNGICNGPMCGIVKPWDYCSHGERGGDT